MHDPHRKGTSSNRAAGIWQEQSFAPRDPVGLPALQGAGAAKRCCHLLAPTVSKPGWLPKILDLPQIHQCSLTARRGHWGGLSKSATNVGKRGTGGKGLSCCRLSTSNTEQLPHAPRTFHTTLLCPALPRIPAQPLLQQCHDKFLKRNRTMQIWVF